ncbi:hypothetical protein D3C72_1963450 [compost metagenome]
MGVEAMGVSVEGPSMRRWARHRGTGKTRCKKKVSVLPGWLTRERGRATDSFVRGIASKTSKGGRCRACAPLPWAPPKVAMSESVGVYT